MLFTKRIHILQYVTVMYMAGLIAGGLYCCIGLAHPSVFLTDYDRISNSIYFIFLNSNVIGNYILGAKSDNIYKSGRHVVS